MRVFVYSRPAIEAIAPRDVPHVIISITTAVDDLAKLRTNENCRGVLRLSFVDQDVVLPEFPDRILFGEEQAREVWRFIDEHRDHIDELLLHCDAGQSRSPAVAAAIARDATGDDNEYFRRYRPNMRVYRTLLEARANG